MSFEPAWLDLREPADHAARAPALPQALAAWLRARRQPVRVLDLGCGSGSTLRALAPLLGEGQDWVLLDHDPALLQAARARLLRWAGSGLGAEALELEGPGWSARVRLLRADLREVEALPLQDRALVTASALFDLVSESWLGRLAARLRGRALYAALTFDGRLEMTPADAADAALREAFLAHQRRDKGFGPALGPEADAACARFFAGGGWDLQRARSDWRLDAGAADLQAALLEGLAAAAAEQEPALAEQAAAWLARRRVAIGESLLRVGHGDLLALPAPEPGG